MISLGHQQDRKFPQVFGMIGNIISESWDYNFLF
jgi:hypothetical protein